jgi:DNA-binding NarL/FixJ family response regulator
MRSVDPDAVAYAPEPAAHPLATAAVPSRADEVRLRQLSERERQVLAHFAQGRSTKSVAQILGISPRTIETYSVLIVQKLRARNRIHAVAIALRTGILTEQDR